MKMTKNTASSLLFELLTVVMYCSSNVPWGQNILLTWRLLPIKRLVKCRADIQGNTSPAFKGQFFLAIPGDFGSATKWFLPWIHWYPRDMFFFGWRTSKRQMKRRLISGRDKDQLWIRSFMGGNAKLFWKRDGPATKNDYQVCSMKSQ